MKNAYYLFWVILLHIYCLSTSVYADTVSSVLGKVCIIRSAMSSNYVIDVYYRGTENGTNVQLYQANNTPAQTFIISKAGNGYYKIVNTHSNKAIDVSGGMAGDEVNVHIWEQNGTDAQLFKFEDAGNGYYYIKNKLGYYLDVYGAKCEDWTNIQTCRKNGGNNQKWLLTAINSGITPNNGYDATLSHRTVTLGKFSTFDEWQQEMRRAEISVIGLNNYFMRDPMNGSIMAETGKVIVGIKVLSYEIIKVPAPNAMPDPKKLPKNYNWRSKSPIPISAYGANTVKLKLPKKLQFTLHTHNYRNHPYFNVSALQVKMTCSCGFSYGYEWELPWPDMKADSKAVYEATYKELPR